MLKRSGTQVGLLFVQVTVDVDSIAYKYRQADKATFDDGGKVTVDADKLAVIGDDQIRQATLKTLGITEVQGDINSLILIERTPEALEAASTAGQTVKKEEQPPNMAEGVAGELTGGGVATEEASRPDVGPGSSEPTPAIDPVAEATETGPAGDGDGGEETGPAVAGGAGSLADNLLG